MRRLCSGSVRVSALWLLAPILALSCTPTNLEGAAKGAPVSAEPTVESSVSAPLSTPVSNAANPGVVEIDDLARYTQILALSDPHGEFEHLGALLRGAHVTNATGRWTAGKTLLIVCGDSIDKGPASVPILDLWKRLEPEARASGGKVVVLLGNHEAEFLSDPRNRKTEAFQQELRQAKLTPEQVASGTDRRGIGRFLRGMPLAARVGTYLFAHAGWYPPDMPWLEFKTRAKRMLAAGLYNDAFITGEHSILEEKTDTPPGKHKAKKWYDNADLVHSLETRLTALKLYGVVFGHQPDAFQFNSQIGAVDNFRIIKIDTGMAPDAEEGPGEILRFPHPTDLLKFSAPAADRLLPDGTTAEIKVKSMD